jgi:hypothetical protein
MPISNRHACRAYSDFFKKTKVYQIKTWNGTVREIHGRPYASFQHDVNLEKFHRAIVVVISVQK